MPGWEDFDFSDPTGGMDIEKDALMKRLAMAQALQNQPQPAYRSPLAAGIGGGAKIASALAGTFKSNDALARLEELAKRQQTAISPERKLKLAMAQQEMANASAPVAQPYRDVAKKFGFALPEGMTQAQAKPVLDLMEKAYAADQRAKELQLNRWSMMQNREDRAGEKQEKDLDKQIETLSRRLETAPALRNDLATLETAAADEDIAGVGPIAGRLPEWMLSAKGTQNRQAIKGIVGKILKEESGVAVSPKELDRKLDELGMGSGATETQYRLGLERVTKMAQDLIKAKEAGARPEAVAEARRRGLVTSQDIAPSKAAAGISTGAAPVQVKTEADYAALPSGAEYIDPNGKRKRKK